ncbi:MAG: ATP-binding protein [Thermoleophilia bacterium]
MSTSTPSPALDPRRLADVLVHPREDLDLELKSWLDMKDNCAKATVAKAICALANHGGGLLIFGLEEAGHDVREAPGRPADLGAYTRDEINNIVLKYLEPGIHCQVEVAPRPSGGEHPIVVVPGGHRFPIRTKKDGPTGCGISKNVYFIRRPGPRSEPPQTGQEWDDLLRRCIRNQQLDAASERSWRHIKPALDATTVVQEQREAMPPSLDSVELDSWESSSLRRLTDD